MTQRQDIERLRNYRGWLQSFQPERDLTEYFKALDAAIAHLDQPYEYGELIDVTVVEDFYTFLTGSYMASTPDGRVVVGFADGEIRRFPYHRHPKQTVQVTLDKEIVEAAKGLAGEYVIRNHYTPKDVCKALAIAQEGEE